MIIIFGRRQYGRVDACGSEYAHTTFAHLYYVPLIPINSFWVTHEVGSQRSGFPIPLHGKSVAAAYLRVWAPIAAIAMLSAAPIVVGGPAAFGLVALSVWAWTWRSIRGELAVRRSDFNRLAFGLRCEPSAMSPALRVELKSNLSARWDRLGAARAPNDVGRFGAADPGEAVTAYGLLRLSALEHGGRDEHEAAERILRGMHDKLPAEDGPYREAAAPAPASVHAQIAAAAANVEAQRNGAAHVAAIVAARAKAPVSRAKAMLVGSLVAGAIAAGGLIETSPALRAPATGTLEELVTAHGAGDYVTVSCDESVPAGDLTTGERVTHHVSLCGQGERVMALVGGADMKDPSGSVTGKLTKPSYDDRNWFEDIRVTPGITPYYLDVTSQTEERVEAGLCIGLAFGALGLGAFALRARRRAKRAPVAA